MPATPDADALHELERRHEQLFGTLPDPMFALDGQLRFIAAGTAFAQLTRRSAEALNGRPFIECVAERHAETVLQHLQQALAGSEQRFEAPCLRAGGDEFTLAVSVNPVRSDGAITGLYGTGRDVTELRETERALAESEERYRLLADHVQDMISLHDVAGAFLYASPSAYTLLGHHPVELVGRSVYELVEPDDVPVLRAAHETIMRREGRGPVAFRARRADGRVHWYETTAHVVMRDERPWRIVATTRDVTDRRAVEQQMVQAQKMDAIGRLASGVAHDFSNILTVIGGQAELLLSRLAAGSAERDGVEHIREAAYRAAAMTRRLLMFSRGSAAEPRPADANTVILELHTMLTHLLRHDIQLVTQLEPALRWVACDASALEQIIINLAMNARDAMPGGGRLLVRTRNVKLREDQHAELPAGEYVQLLVSDTGAGMDEATAARAFEPFFSARERAGAGLGLATVYSLVRESNGAVAVESRPGAGTTFTLLLPAVDPPPMAAQSHPVALTRLDGTETVLVAEDDASVRTLVVAALQRHGYRVMAAVDGLQALELYRTWSHVIDLIVTDVNMPEMAGTELARVMDENGDLVPVLFISGFTAETLQLEEPGVRRAFLAKPFTPLQLAAMVRRLLNG